MRISGNTNDDPTPPDYLQNNVYIEVQQTEKRPELLTNKTSFEPRRRGERRQKNQLCAYKVFQKKNETRKKIRKRAIRDM